jgi:cytochrome P450 family 6
MEYLDMVIHETLRRYISVGVLTRVCTQAYVLPGYPNITIKAGQEVHINAAGIQMDPKHYPNTDRGNNP